MELNEALEIIRTIDTNLKYYVAKFDIWIYVILFLVVYAKTAFVITTFLPGDSTVFASATLAAMGYLNIWVLLAGFFIATSLGDHQNRFIGKMLGNMTVKHPLVKKAISPKLVVRAKRFLETYGQVAITFSRFIPLMRTMTPFIAGYTTYPYHHFFVFNFVGAVCWTLLWSGTGLLLGNIQWVADNFVFTLMLISAIAIVPSMIGFIKRTLVTQEEI